MEGRHGAKKTNKQTKEIHMTKQQTKKF